MRNNGLLKLTKNFVIFPALLAVCVMLASMSGCATSTAQLSGHDEMDNGLRNLDVALQEYHASWETAQGKVADNLVVALVDDVERDPAKKKEYLQQFLNLRAMHRSQLDNERMRYDAARNTIKMIEDINVKLRGLSETRLGWDASTKQYFELLRDKTVKTGTRQ